MREKRELNYKTSIGIIFIALFGLLSTQATAASFDCKKATTWVEKTVCSTPELSQLDDNLAITYHDALTSLSLEGQKETKEYQRKWLKERYPYCEAKTKLYISRAGKCDDKCYDNFKKNGSHDYKLWNECKKKCQAAVAERKLDFTDTKTVGLITECLKDAYRERVTQLLVILTKFPDRIFRNVHVMRWEAVHFETDDPDDVTKQELTYPQIENPRDENEKFWNTFIFKLASDDLKSSADEGDIYSTYTVSFNNKHLISLQREGSVYAHGAPHGYTSKASFNRLLEAKRELQASDLFDNKTGWRKKLMALVSKELKELNEDKDEANVGAPYKIESSALMGIITNPSNWVFSKGAFSIQFSEYTLGSRSSPLITIYWKDIDPYLSKNGRSLISD